MSFDEEYFKSDEFLELLDSYETAEASGETPFMDVDDLADIADYYQYAGKLDEADKVMELAYELYPDATLPNVYKARTALQDGLWDDATEYAGQISDKDDPDYHYLLAEIMVARQQVEEADSYLRDYARQIEPDDYQDFVKDVANLFVDYNINDKAYEWMMRLRNDDSDDFKELMARALFGLGKYKDSARIFNELIDRDPFSKYYWNGLASSQFMNEDYTGALTSSEYAIAIDPSDAESILSKANSLFRIGNYEEAYDYYGRYGKVTDADAFSLLHQGVCLVNLNRQTEAIPLLEEALAKDKEEDSYLVQIYQELAFCYSSQHRIDEALAMLDKTEELDCDHEDMLVVRGHLLLENDRIDEAQAVFRRAIYLSHNAPAIMLRVIVSLYDNHYVEACYHTFKKFFAMLAGGDEEFNDGYSYMALCCYDMGNVEEFLMYLRIAVERNPREARLVLGFLFPSDMAAKDYYTYMYKKLKK